MTQRDKDIILEALSMKEASVKRAMAAKATSPRFKEVYEAELMDVSNARKEVIGLKVQA